MKRRKKLWIACAALAVVVCAVALIRRPAQFGFLRDAQVESVEIAAWSHSGRDGPFVYTRYRLYPPKEDVLSQARQELSAKSGWVWEEPIPTSDSEQVGPTVTNPTTDTDVAFESNFVWSRRRKPDFVFVARPPTPFERILYWAGMRSR